jgi:hypothetical protein
MTKPIGVPALVCMSSWLFWVLSIVAPYKRIERMPVFREATRCEPEASMEAVALRFNKGLPILAESGTGIVLCATAYRR